MAKRLTRSPERTKNCLIASARKLFALCGFNGTTVQEIADEAGVNVSLISHYFKGKEGLYHASIEGFAEARLQALERTLETPRSAEEFRFRLEMFVNELLEFHLENQEVTTILLRDMIYESHLWGKRNQTTLFQFMTRLTEYFREARDMGFMNSNIEPMIAAGIVYLTISGLLQANEINERQLKISLKSRDLRKQIIAQTLDSLWQGFDPGHSSTVRRAVPIVK